MRVEETISKDMNISDATSKKKSIILDIAKKIRDSKNRISKVVFEDFDYFIENVNSKFTFNDYIYKKKKVKVNLRSQVDTETLEDIYVKYDQRRDVIKQKVLNVTVTHVKKVEYYKVKTRHGVFTIPAGAVKEIKYDNKKTDVSIFIGTLSMFCYYSDIKGEFVKYINNKIEILETELSELNQKKKTEFSQEDVKTEKNLNKSIEHFKLYLKYVSDENFFERTLKVAKMRYERIMKKENEKPIEFKTLNFRGRSKVNIFVDKNSNEKSKIGYFIDLGGIAADYGYKKLYLPVKFIKSYHESLEDYRKHGLNGNNYQYQVVFDKDNNPKITVGKKNIKEYPDVRDDMVLIGGDENIKHNLEQFSDGSMIDWPRKLIDELVRYEIKEDKIKKKIDSLEKTIQIKKRNAELSALKADISNEVSSIKQYNNTVNQIHQNIKGLQRQIDADVQRSISAEFKYLISTYGEGNVHIVLENIDGMFGSSHIKYKTNDGLPFSQNKTFRLAHFGEVKDKIKRMGANEKYSIPVSKTVAYYSSQICPFCGTIERNNRLTQEKVICVICGEEAPADRKSSQFLTLTVSEAVLRDALLVLDETGAYAPKKNLKKETVKKLYETNGHAITQGFKKFYLYKESDKRFDGNTADEF